MPVTLLNEMVTLMRQQLQSILILEAHCYSTTLNPNGGRETHMYGPWGAILHFIASILGPNIHPSPQYTLDPEDSPRGLNSMVPDFILLGLMGELRETGDLTEYIMNNTIARMWRQNRPALDRFVEGPVLVTQRAVTACVEIKHPVRYYKEPKGQFPTEYIQGKIPTTFEPPGLKFRHR
jgi:hypothetical protein